MGNEISCLSPNAGVTAATGGRRFGATIRNMVDDINDGSKCIPPRVMRWARRTIKRRVGAATLKGMDYVCLYRQDCGELFERKRDLRFRALVVLRDELKGNGFTTSVVFNSHNHLYDYVEIAGLQRQ